MKRRWFHLTELARAGAAQNGTPTGESCLKHTERNLLPSRVPLVLCRWQCRWLHGTPNMVSCPVLRLIAAFKKWSLSHTINIYIIILTFFMGPGRNYFKSEPVILRAAWACLSRELLGLSAPEPSSPSGRFGVNSWSPACTNKQGHFQTRKARRMPVGICGPSSIIPSSFRCYNCLKSQCPKGTNETKSMKRIMSYWSVCVGVWMCVYKYLY